MGKSFAVPDGISGRDIKNIRQKLSMTQREFAELLGVSVKSVERWEPGEKSVTGPIVLLLRLLDDNPELVEKVRIPEKKSKLRLLYMYKDNVCTLIDVDDNKRRVRIKNYTGLLQYRAFGVIETPSYDDYLKFLESRCFPRSRDKMKIILKELDIPFYDPMLIIEKTEGRMAEDDFWIKIER